MMAKKSYKRGGKVVAQGADRADLRAERKMERKGAREDKKASRKTKRNYKRLIKEVNKIVKGGKERMTLGL